MLKFKLSAKNTVKVLPMLADVIKFLCDVDDVEINITVKPEQLFGGEFYDETIQTEADEATSACKTK